MSSPITSPSSLWMTAWPQTCSCRQKSKPNLLPCIKSQLLMQLQQLASHVVQSLSRSLPPRVGSGPLRASQLSALMRQRASAAHRGPLPCASCSDLCPIARARPWPLVMVMQASMQQLPKQLTQGVTARPRQRRLTHYLSGKEAATAAPLACMQLDPPMGQIPALQP